MSDDKSKNKIQLEAGLDVTPVKQGAAEIKGEMQSAAASVAQSAQVASKAIDGIGAGGASAAQKVGETAKSISDSIKRVPAAANEATKSLSDWQKFVGANMASAMKEFGGHGPAMKALGEQWRAMSAEAKQAAAGVTQAASSMTQGIAPAVPATNQLTAAQARFLETLKRQAIGLTDGKAVLLEYRAAQMGLGDAATPYITKIREAEKAVNAGTIAFDKHGLSAKQTAAALRQVPAQLQDIVVSLQGGQAPLTVFLQQGSQLSTVFGGAGAALRAVGGYVLGLVNPFTVAAAAAVSLGVAYNQGSKEADAYRNALILTGNAAGTTANQLADMAARVSKSVGTQGQAAAALAELAGTGRIAAGNLEYFTRVAVQMEKTVGKSAKETAKDLAELAKSPLATSEKLNEQYRYLTASVYEQIKALEEQGRKEEAAAAAQIAYSRAFDQRTKEIKENLGAIESAYKDVIGLGKHFWDTVAGVGRTSTNSDMLKSVRESIAGAESRISRLNVPGAGLLNKLLVDIEERRIAAWRTEEAQLLKVAQAESDRAKAAADAQKQEEARIGWLKEGDKYLSKAAQMEREIAKARNEGAAAGAAQADIEKRVASIREKFADKASISAVAQEQKKLADILAQSAGLTSNFAEEWDLLGKAYKRGEISLSALTQSQATLLAKQPAINAGLDAEKKAREELAKAAEKMVDAGAKDIRSLEEQIAKQQAHNAAIGRSKEDAADLAAMKYDLAAASDEELAANLRNAAAYAGDLHDAYVQHATDLEKSAQLRRQLAADMRSGGIAESLLEAEKKAMQEWKRDFDRIDNWLGDALQRGFESGKGFLRSMLDSFKGAAIRLAIQPFTAPFAAFGASMMNPGAAQAAGATNGLMQGASMLSAGKSLWDGFSTAASTVGGWLGLTGMGAAGATGITAAAGTGLGLASAGSGIGFAASGLGSASGLSLVGSGTSAGLTLGTAGTTAVTGTAGAITGAGGAAGAGGVSGLAAAAPWIAGAAAVAAILVKGLSSKTVGSGILGSITGDEFSGNAYEFKRGGFLKGGSKTVTSELDRATDEVFSSAIRAMSSNFSVLGETIGAGGDLLKDFSYEFRLALADFDDAGKQQEIQRALSTMSDSMAQAFVDSFRTSIDTAQQAASRYFTNTSDGARTFTGGVVDKAAVSSELDPFISDIIRVFDKQREALSGVTGSEGKLAEFTKALFGLGDGLVRNSGYLKQFGETLDFIKLEAVANKGETVVDTFARLNAVFAATNSVAAALQQDVETAFGQIGLASTAARERLITLAGGLESLASGTTFFAQNFLTEAEQLVPTQKLVADEMARLGKAGITTHEQFKELVKGLNLADEADARLFASLMRVAPAFDNVADAAASAAETAKQAAADARRAAEENAMAVVEAAFSGLQRSVDAERNALRSVFDSAMESLQAGLDGVNSRIGKLTGLSGALKSTIDRITVSGTADTERASAKAQIETAIALARTGGVFPEAASLSKSLDIVSNLNENAFSSFADFQREQLQTKNKLQELAGLTDSQLSIEEQTLKSIEDQIKATEDGFKTQNAYLDGILDSAQMQIDALNGIDTSIKPLADAIASLNKASTAAGGGSIGGQVGGPISKTYLDELGNSPFSIDLPTNADLVRDWYKAAGQPADAEGVAYWTKELSRTDVSQRDVKATFAAIVEELTGKKLQSFAVGTNWVPNDMKAQIHEGERIVPKADNTAIISALRNRGADNAAVVNALQRVEKLLENISAETRATAQHSNGTKKILQRVVPDGDAIATRAEA